MHSDDPEIDVEVVEYARDDKIDDAETDILDFFHANQGKVFYERQLTVIFERSYFHWITVKALLELSSGGSINSETLELVPGVPIRFFWAKGNRYWKRQAARVINLVRRFSDTTVTRAIGFRANYWWTPRFLLQPLRRSIETCAHSTTRPGRLRDTT